MRVRGPKFPRVRFLRLVRREWDEPELDDWMAAVPQEGSK